MNRATKSHARVIAVWWRWLWKQWCLTDVAINANLFLGTVHCYCFFHLVSFPGIKFTSSLQILSFYFEAFSVQRRFPCWLFTCSFLCDWSQLTEWTNNWREMTVWLEITDRSLTDWLTEGNWLTEWLTDWLKVIYWLTDYWRYLTDWLIEGNWPTEGRLTDWPTDWLTKSNWLADWVTKGKKANWSESIAHFLLNLISTQTKHKIPQLHTKYLGRFSFVWGEKGGY